MAHPYSSTPLYAGTPSYAPQQQPYYTPYPSNGLQQQMQTLQSPGLSQQPAQGPGQMQSFPTYQQQQQPLPAPSINGPSFEQNSQVPPAGHPFPLFPPPMNFNSDFFKQFAGAGFPPPPPPNLPPMPIPSPGYPQLHATNTTSSSPYPQYPTAGAQGYGSGFAQNEQLGQHGGNQYIGSQQGGQPGMDWQRDTQAYSAPTQSGSTQNPRPVSRGVINLVNHDKDQSLPSFGSRSDLDMLFAAAQNQTVQATTTQDTQVPQDPDDNDTTDHILTIDGGASPYDPARPATVSDRSSGGFGAPSAPSKSVVSKKVERTYDNKSHTELRQLAKGAVLSLMPHKILYNDLIREGVNPQILRALYGELGLKVEPDQTQSSTDQQDSTTASARPAASGLQSAVASHASKLQLTDSKALPPPAAPFTTTSLPSVASEPIPPPAVLDVRKQQSAPSPSLERKDRIAQLLAAKAGRPTPPPTTATSAQQEETTAPSFPLPSTNTTEAAVKSSSQNPLNLAGAVAFQQAAGINKSKAQTELVKQKMEQLRREAQARAEAGGSQPPRVQPGTPDHNRAVDGSKSTPQFGNVTPLTLSKMSSFVSQNATSMIPGLFMSSLESSRPDGSIGHSSPFQRPVSSTVPAKHPLDSDPTSLPTQQPSKRAKMQQLLPPASAVATQDDDLGEQSEGEVIEESGADAITFDQQPGQFLQEYQPSELSAVAATDSVRTGAMDHPSMAALQNNSSGGPPSNQLYRDKQSEIENMRRKIAEMEQRNQLKRTRSQMELPTFSKPATPPVAGQDQQPISSPIAHTTDLIGNRQFSGARTTSRLTREQLQERTATLKADLLKRAQRQHVLQEGLPGLNAEVSKTETRLDLSRKELAQVRAQLQSLQAELNRLATQERDLAEEVARFERQLKEGQEGQKEYSNELQQIKLDNLAQEGATTAQQDSEASLIAQPPTNAVPQAHSGLGNGDMGNQDLAYQDGQPLPDLLADPAAAIYTVDDGDAEMQMEDNDGSPATDQIEDSGYDNAEATPTFEAAAEYGQEMQADDFEEPSTAHHFESPTIEEVQSTDAQLQAALDDQLGAGDMEISPEPEDYEESHESMPTHPDNAQDFTDEAMDMNDDSDGSASMSGSDDDEEDYEPAEADTSVPIQQSDEEEEYDPETAPVEGGTPTTAVEDGNENYPGCRAAGVSVALQDQLPVNGISRAASDAVESSSEADATLENVAAVSEVPANTQDDLESRAQLTEADSLTKPPPGYSRQADVAPLLDGSSMPSVHYMPYKTPFSSFRSYRFHSDFTDTVKTGYRSLTYSNNIDPARPLCPIELSGQVCADTSCEEQHFSQLGLPDEKILVQMSSASDIKDKAVRDDFHAGLKGVIAGLRANDVKDFEKVADALSKYRRDFFAEREEKGRQEVEVKSQAVVPTDEGQLVEAS